MNILLLGPNQINKYNWGHQLFRNEINNFHKVTYYGIGYPNFDSSLKVPDIIDKFGPFDLLLTHTLRDTASFEGIGKTNIKKVHIATDLFPPYPDGYKPGTNDKHQKFIESNKYDLFFYVQRSQAEYLKQMGVHTTARWLPFSVDTHVYRHLSLPKIYDVLTSSTTRPDVYPNREKINTLVKQMGLKAVTGKIVHENYISAINQSKICIISTNVFKTPNMKFTEFTACGTLVLSDRPDDMKQLGFIDGHHIVIYKNFKDLEKKIGYYLTHDKQRETIAKAGMKFTREYHSNHYRIKKMFEVIHKELKLK